MARRVQRIENLTKRHRPTCTNRAPDADLTRCRCPWRGRYRGKDVNLARWSRTKIDPTLVGPAEAVLKRLTQAIDDRDFDPAGERPPLGTAQSFKAFLQEWLDHYATPQGLSMDSLRPMVNVLKDSPLGRYSLEDLAGNAEVIEAWLNAEAITRRWSDKTWVEYRGLLFRVCKQATLWKRHDTPRMKVNPIAGIATRTPAEPEHFKQRHLLEDVEDKLFAVVGQMDRPQYRSANKRAKLTQEEADTIRLAVAAGWLQKDLAASFEVSPAVICDVIAGRIWNPDTIVMGTKGREMRRRLMAAFDLGLRVTEMLLVQLKHVDWKRPRLLTAADGSTFNGYRIVLPATNTKGGKTTGKGEEVYCGTQRLSAELEARRFQLQSNPEAYIFGTEAGGPQQGFRRLWRELFTLAGLDYGRDKGLVWHTTRHEYISRLADDPENTPALTQKLARHKRAETTQGYMHLRADAEWTAVAGLNRRK